MEPSEHRTEKTPQAAIDDFKRAFAISDFDMKEVLGLFDDIKDETHLKHFTYKMEVMGAARQCKSSFALSAGDLDIDNDEINKFLKFLLENEYVMPGNPVFLYDFLLDANRLFNDDVIERRDVKRIKMFRPDTRTMQYDPVAMTELLWKSLISLYYTHEQGTVVIDTSNAFGNMLHKYLQYLLVDRVPKLAKYGEILQLLPSDVRVVDDMMMCVLAFMQLTKFHFIFITNMYPEHRVITNKDGTSTVVATGNMIPTSHHDLPFSMDVVLQINEVRDDDVTYKFTKTRSAWETIVPDVLSWNDPTYVDVINTVCKFSHYKILKREFQ